LEPQVAFGRVLRELRLERGLSQEQLALDAGIQRNYVSLLERGRNAATVTMIFKLAHVLDLPTSALLERVELLVSRRPKTRTPSGRRPSQR
jgi:transcriptional regulator with XRE-family HTH domain